MDNPDPTQFISILAHKAALVDQQAEFDNITKANAESLAAKDAEIAAKDAEIATLQSKAAASDAKDVEIAALTAQIEELTATPPIEVVANWRAKAVLALSGLLPMVEQAITSMEGDAGVVARYAWDGGADFARNGPTVLALAAALQLTDEQLDAMFTQAASLEV